MPWCALYCDCLLQPLLFLFSLFVSSCHFEFAYMCNYILIIPSDLSGIILAVCSCWPPVFKLTTCSFLLIQILCYDQCLLLPLVFILQLLLLLHLWDDFYSESSVWLLLSFCYFFLVTVCDAYFLLIFKLELTKNSCVKSYQWLDPFS